MKTLIISIICTIITLNLYSNDIFIYENAKNVKGEIVETNSVANIDLTENLTYSLKQNLSIITKEEESLLYGLSSKTFIQQEANTSVYFNEFDIEFENDFENPEHLIVKDAIANFSVFEGELYVIQRAENVNTTIMTPLANINFGESKIFIKTSTEYTTVYVFEGVVFLYETKGNKMYQVAKDTVITVSPAPKTWGVRSPIGNNHTFTEYDLNKLEIGTKQDLSDLYKKLQYSFDNTIFVNFGQQIVGIKYTKRKTNN